MQVCYSSYKRQIISRDVRNYITPEGRNPFRQWLTQLQDKRTRANIQRRSALSKSSGIDAEIFLDALSTEDALRLDIISTILESFECQLSVEPRADMDVKIETADVNETYPQPPATQ